jgi:hypothetical protein
MKISDLFDVGESTYRRIERDLLRAKIQLLESGLLKNIKEKITHTEPAEFSKSQDSKQKASVG